MKRNEAIQNAMQVMNYLSMYESAAFLTLNINRYTTRIHHFHKNTTKEEVRRTAKILDSLRLAGLRLNLLVGARVYLYNKYKSDCDQFDLIWDIDND